MSTASADDPVAAQKFAAGSRASERRDWGAAEALFEESIRLSPSVGAYFNRGYCLEQLGRRGEAYRDYREAERLASLRDDARGQTAHDAAARLLATLHYVELDVPPDVARNPAVHVVVDGAEISEAQRRETLLSESATHTVTVSAPGRMPWTRSGIPDRARVTVQLGPPAVADAAPAPGDAPRTGLGANEIVALSAMGAGAVTLGVSAVLFFTGAAHIHTLNDSKSRDCATAGPSSGACAGDDANARSYRSDIAVATTALDITGAVLVVGGAALWFLSPKRSATMGAIRPQVGTHQAGLTWSAALP